MRRRQIPDLHPIFEIRLPKIVNLSTTLYELLQFIKVRRKGISDGPAEVNRSLSSLKQSGEIRAKRLGRIPRNSRVWIGSGPIVKSKLENVKFLRPAKFILGPNLDIHNPHVRTLLEGIENAIFLVPSEWVLNYYVEVLGIAHSKIQVWAAGVNTEMWKPRDTKKNMVLIYQKGNYQEFGVQISKILNLLGYEVSILRYGTYAQSTYLDLLNRCKFAVFLSGTESQGLAQFQAWSMDVPTFVLAQRSYIDPKSSDRIIAASSSPYLTDATGSFFEMRDAEASIHKFVEKLDSFAPRKWVLANYSDDKTAKEFLQLFY
jgi:hypothetical protein